MPTAENFEDRPISRICQPGFLGFWTILLHLSLMVMGAQEKVDAQPSIATRGATVSVTDARGKIWSWGDNSRNQYGDGTNISLSAPKLVDSGMSWLKMVHGAGFTAAIRQDGTLWAWGNPPSSDISRNWQVTPAPTPLQVGAANTWVSIAAGTGHILALKSDGTLWAWGSNDSGELGLGHTDSIYVPTQVGSASNWTSIAAGQNHSLGIRADGSLWSWGLNSLGQLGIGAPSFGTGAVHDSKVPIQVPSTTPWVKVSSYSHHNLAIKADGTLWAWGRNTNGQVGDSSLNDRTSPVPISAATDWVDVSAGTDHSLALRSDRSLWAWGSNGVGQLGDGTGINRFAPVPVATSYQWDQIAAGEFTSYALRSDGVLWSWGYNIEGQLGLGAELPGVVRAGSDSDWAKVSSGAYFALGIKSDGSLWGWGVNDSGQMSDSTTSLRLSPAKIANGTTWTQISAGYAHALGIRADGSLWAWGANDQGQLGDGSQNRKLSMVQVGADTDWTQVSAGGKFSLALRSDGSLWAWGANGFGQLGNGSFTPGLAPTRVGTQNNWVRIAAGDSFALAIKSDGTLWSWGNSFSGQLGTGTTNSSTVPVQVGTQSGWAQISAGNWHSLAIRSDGSLWAWGDGYSGQLGDGTFLERRSPVRIGTANNWISIAAGSESSWMINSSGELWTSGATMNVLNEAISPGSPVQIGSNLAWASISSSTYQFQGIKQDGSLWSYGEYFNVGQLGNGKSVSYNPLPTATRFRASGPWAVLAPTSNQVAFGALSLGSPPPARSFTLTSGSQAFNLTNLLASSPFTLTHDCPATLPPNTGCNLQLGMNPVYAGGVYGKLLVEGDGPVSGGSIILSGVVFAGVVASPVITNAVASTTQITLSFTPAAAGSLPILDYEANCSLVGVPNTSFTARSNVSPIQVPVQYSNQYYDCQVSGRTSQGFLAASAVVRVLVGLQPQTISWLPPATLPVGSSLIASATGGGSGNPVTFQSLFSTCTTSGTNGSVITAVSVGSCVVNVSQAGNASFAAAALTRSIEITRAEQVIDFPAQMNRYQSESPIIMAATGGASGNPVVFSSSTPSTCTTTGSNGATITFVGTGTCTLQANQAGNPNYIAAAPVSRSFSVLPAQDFLVTVTTLAGSNLSSAPAGLACSSGCSANFAGGTQLSITTSVPGTHLFTGWTGVTCSGGNSQPTCAFRVTGTINLTATFQVIPATSNLSLHDLNDDGKSDIVWRNDGTGANWYWAMNAITITAQGPITTLPVDWQIQSTAVDFDGDGKSDILLRNMTTGQPWVWFMNGNSIIGGGGLPTLSDMNWIIAGTGDLNGDGKGDVIWRNTSTGQNWWWALNGTAIINQGQITDLPVDWAIQSTLGDFNGDGKTDILWRNTTTGQPWVWMMDGNNIINNGPLPTLSDLNWIIAGTGDLNGDGKHDVVWRNTATGANWYWALNGTTITAQGPITTLPVDWQIQSTSADFDGDGRADILLRNMITGQPWVWFMNGNTITGGGPLPTLSDMNWQIRIKK